MAHRDGMRISRVCAWGTSRYACDGSGTVKRGSKSSHTRGNYSICEFPGGKLYNCDLSASQNIGARVFLREFARRKDCPPIPHVPQRTLGDLWKVNIYYDSMAASAA